jgi:hypothetical protein
LRKSGESFVALRERRTNLDVAPLHDRRVYADWTRARTRQAITQHHRRVVRPTIHPLTTIGVIERAQPHARDRAQHEPREVALGNRFVNLNYAASLERNKCLAYR